MPFDPVDPRQSFPELERGILEYWKKEDIFRRSMRARVGGETFRFYDGPPFATGLPHYGHLLAGTVKDVIPRYQTMRGKHVQRRFGWDCHGLPIENLVEKEHGITCKQDIEKKGIAWFNGLCRASVQRYTKEWRATVERMGRFVDMDWDYRTMDPEYMESIWWVFKELWNKKLIAEGHKPMHVCPRCATPLSNFEVTLGYKDVTDLGVTIRFEIKNPTSVKKNASKLYVLAWTTTPWTLPGNLFLAINTNLDYYVWEKAGEQYVAASNPKNAGVFQDQGFKGKGPVSPSKLLGANYTPPFPYFVDWSKNAFRIVDGTDFVTAEEGTGIVHIAPGFGEDDYRVWERESKAPHPNRSSTLVTTRHGPLPMGEGMPLLQHVTIDGKFIDDVKDFAGLEVKPKDDTMKTDRKIAEYLEKKGLLFAKDTIRHSYPHCWRCDSPLLNYATSSWFVKVENIKEDLLLCNKETEWMPEHLRDGRFGKWLENAHDWAISRKRYWGTPLPIWRVCHGSSPLTTTQCVSSRAESRDDTHNIVVIGSRDDLMDHCRIRFTKITILRHGESDGNIQGIYQGTVPGTSLTEEGKRQAAAASELLHSETIAAIYCSPLARTRQTAAILAKATGASVIEDERLKESGFGPYEGKPIGLDERAFLRAARRNHLLDPGNPADFSQAAGMELWAEVQQRTDSFLAEILPRHRSDHIVIVSHVDPIQNMKHFFTKEDPAKIVKQPIPAYATPESFFHDHDRGTQMDLHRDCIDDIVWPGCASPSSVDLTLVRHGETDWNKEQRSQGGQSDIPLNAEGRKQAIALAKTLRATHRRVMVSGDEPFGMTQAQGDTSEQPFDVIISSDLSRAIETADILSKALGIPHEEKWKILRERDTGAWGGLSFDDIFTQHPPAHANFQTSTFHHATPPNGESLSRLLERAEEFCEELLKLYPGKRVLCVSHGGMIRALRTICENLSYKEAACWKISNAETISLPIHPPLRRIPDVLDCWFESGSMPYAEQHFPFEGTRCDGSSPLTMTHLVPSVSSRAETREDTPPGFPADFIAENLDQTRGWFYTLMVLSTALFQKPAFHHCICGGIILAEDGKKMSKRLKNYPDPHVLMDKHGADALRFALMSSPVVRAETLRFSEQNVSDVVQKFLLPLWNSYSFFVTYANLAQFSPGPSLQSSFHPLDRWIRAEVQDLCNRMTAELDRYDLSAMCGEFHSTLDALTNWYIRLSRRRFAGKDADEQGDLTTDRSLQHSALSTLYEVLLTLARLLAPVCPFIAEAITLNLVAGERTSVHLMDWPLSRLLTTEEERLLRKNRVLRQVVSLGLRARSEARVKLRQPLSEASIAIPPSLLPIAEILREDELLLEQELNVKRLHLLEDAGELGSPIAIVDARKAGPRLGARVQDVIAAGKLGEFETRDDGSVRILDELLTCEEVRITYQGKEGGNIAAERGIVLRIDARTTKELEQEGFARDIIRAVQRLRKDAGLSLADRIVLRIDGIDDVLNTFQELIARETNATLGISDSAPHVLAIDATDITIRFHRP